MIHEGEIGKTQGLFCSLPSPTFPCRAPSSHSLPSAAILPRLAVWAPILGSRSVGISARRCCMWRKAVGGVLLEERRRKERGVWGLEQRGSFERALVDGDKQKKNKKQLAGGSRSCRRGTVSSTSKSLFKQICRMQMRYIQKGIKVSIPSGVQTSKHSKVQASQSSFNSRPGPLPPPGLARLPSPNRRGPFFSIIDSPILSVCPCFFCQSTISLGND
jgi:hypothetical protein